MEQGLLKTKYVKKMRHFLAVEANDALCHGFTIQSAFSTYKVSCFNDFDGMSFGGNPFCS